MSATDRERTSTITPDAPIGPILIHEANTVLALSIEHPVSYQEWAFIEVGILDVSKKRLFSVGDEVFRQSGVENGARWSERKDFFSTIVTLREPGKYFLDIKGEIGRIGTTSTTPICGHCKTTITVSQERGSGIPHLLAGVLSLIFGLILYFASNRKAFKSTIYILFLITVFTLSIYAEFVW